MTTIDPNIQIPSSIKWKTNFITINDSNNGSLEFAVRSDYADNFTYLCWRWATDTTTETTVQFQLEWKKRYRYIPSQALIQGGMGEDIYTEWTDWTSDSDYNNTKAADNNYYRTVMPFRFYWTTVEQLNYDYEQWQFRVRAYNSATDTASDWSYSETLDVTYINNPTVSIWQELDDSWNLNIDFNWERPMSWRVYYAYYHDEETDKNVYIKRVSSYKLEASNVDDNYIMNIPSSFFANTNLVVGDTLTLFFYVKYGSKWASYVIPVELGVTPHISTIDIEATITEGEFGEALINVVDQDYTGIHAVMRWTDGDQNKHEE